MTDRFRKPLAGDAQAPSEANSGRLRYLFAVAAGYLLTGAVIGLSISLEHARIQANFDAVAQERGSTLFQQFELVRSWNHQHGGIYLATTGNPGSTAPTEPHFHDGDGKPLALTTPDDMLRQLADLSEYSTDIRYRVIERTPSARTAAANQPDDWETATFEALARSGAKERLGFFPSETAPLHRYMALLNRDERSGQGELALSISMPAQKLAAIRGAQTGSMLLSHLAAFVVIAGLAHLAAHRAYRHVAKLTQLSASQKFLIEERTADLSMANTLLAAEVEERTLSQERLKESESRYRSVLESTQDGVALIQDSQITFANGRLAEMLAMPLKDLVGATWTSLLPEEHREPATLYQTRKLKGDTAPNFLRSQMLHADPATRRITVDIQVMPIKDGGSSVAQWVLNARNVTDRLRAERDRKLVAAVFDSTAEAIMVTDHDNRIVMINPAFTSITGYQANEVLGRHPSVLSSGRHDKNFYVEMWRNIQEAGYWAGEIWNRRKDGSLYVEWLTITALHSREDAAQITEVEGSYVATFTDITHRKEAEDLLRFKASHDTLTGLPNRSLFEDRLHLAISQAKRYRRSFALLYIDLDHFKHVNDTHGHAAGDELLTEAARRMTLCIRESDTLSRFGGDEFAALLSEVDGLEEIEDIAGRIVSALDQRFELAQGAVKISGSVGIAIFPQHGTTADELKHNADLALYNVKESTRNAYRLYSAGMKAGRARS